MAGLLVAGNTRVKTTEANTDIFHLLWCGIQVVQERDVRPFYIAPSSLLENRVPRPYKPEFTLSQELDIRGVQSIYRVVNDGICLKPLYRNPL
jgi:hypothetical protein